MNKVKLFFLIMAILFGVFMFVYGEKDDSPGAQFLGLVLFVYGIYSLIKIKRNKVKENC